jgi:3-mercaptopropionate dioxygenase
MAISRLRDFAAAMTRLIEQQGELEEWVLSPAQHLLSDLVTHDDWLPDLFAMPAEEGYRQYLLYGDPLNRFSLVSAVWKPGQQTNVNDQCMWGLIGVLRGALDAVPYRLNPETDELVAGRGTRLMPGTMMALSPKSGDIHTISNAVLDGITVSIHLYGGNIGITQRNQFDLETGQAHPFVSGYSSPLAPNLWAIG